MKKIGLITFPFVLFFLVLSCDNNDDQPVSSDEKEIVAFSFLAKDNEALSEDVKATIDKDNKTIAAEFPYNIALNALKPSIVISSNAEISPKDNIVADFSNPVVYAVTAEDGTEEKYTVTVINTAITDRDVLIAWHDLNPNNTLDWDFSENIKDWEGVFVVDDRVVQLDIRNKSLPLITPLADNLTELTALTLIGNEIASIPEEIGNLKKLVVLILINNELAVLPRGIGSLKELKSLNLNNNKITELPTEIANLEKLIELELEANQLSDLPMEITQLTELQSLSVYGNRSLTSIPSEIGDLIKLLELNLGYCNLSSVPKEIGNLTSLVNLSIDENVLSDIPPELGNLSSLKTLKLEKNQLTQLPSELGMLSGLLQLFITENQITVVPKEICDLDDLNLLLVKDLKAVCEN